MVAIAFLMGIHSRVRMHPCRTMQIIIGQGRFQAEPQQESAQCPYLFLASQVNDTWKPMETPSQVYTCPGVVLIYIAGWTMNQQCNDQN